MAQTTKEIHLNDLEAQRYQQIDESIRHWSTEYTKAVLQADRLKRSVEAMYQGRMEMINSIMRTQGVDPAHVHQVTVNTEARTASVIYDDSVPNPAADPDEG